MWMLIVKLMSPAEWWLEPKTGQPRLAPRASMASSAPAAGTPAAAQRTSLDSTTSPLGTPAFRTRHHG